MIIHSIKPSGGFRCFLLSSFRVRFGMELGWILLFLKIICIYLCVERTSSCEFLVGYLRSERIRYGFESNLSSSTNS